MSAEEADDIISELGTRAVTLKLGGLVGLSVGNRKLVQTVAKAAHPDETFEHHPALSVTKSIYIISESALDTLMNHARAEARRLNGTDDEA